MSFGLRLLLLLLIAGCAEDAFVVEESDWMIVPAAQRAAIDRKQDADVAAARAEFAAASASLAAMPRTQPAQPRAAAPASADRADRVDRADRADNDVWANALRDQERARIDAHGRVDAAAAAVQRTDLAWRQLRAESAEARLALVVSQREMIRAQAVNRNMRGEDTYDTAPTRGQFSRAQQRWYAVAQRERAARDAYERAGADLASQKEAYAQIMRGAPLRPTSAPDITADDHSARLALDSWSISRSDIRRRRGLRHLLDEAIATPQLRKTTYLLRPAGGPAGTALPPERPTAATGAAANAVAASTRAASPVAAPASAPAARAAAPPAPPAPAFEHPADRAAAASPPAKTRATATASATAAPAPSAKPGATTTAAAPSAKTGAAAAAAAPSAKTGAAPTTAMSAARPATPRAAATTRSAAPAAIAAPDHPADRAAGTAPSPMASAGTPAPAAPPAASRATAPATSAAKPVERPLSEAESHRP